MGILGKFGMSKRQVLTYGNEKPAILAGIPTFGK